MSSGDIHLTLEMNTFSLILDFDFYSYYFYIYCFQESYFSILESFEYFRLILEFTSVINCTSYKQIPLHVNIRCSDALCFRPSFFVSREIRNTLYTQGRNSQARWLREASQIRQMFIPLSEKVWGDARGDQKPDTFFDLMHHYVQMDHGCEVQSTCNKIGFKVGGKSGPFKNYGGKSPAAPPILCPCCPAHTLSHCRQKEE